MAKGAKINYNLDSYDEDPFYKAVMKILNSLNANIGSFTGLPQAPSVLKPLVENYDKIRNALVYPEKGPDTNNARTAIQVVITTNGSWLNPFCAGNTSLLSQTGYPLQKDDVAQTKLDPTILLLTTLPDGTKLDFLISYIVGQGIHYGIMYTLATDTEMDPSQWKFYYASQREGTMPNLISKTEYKMVSFAMGTVNDLTYSPVVTITTL